MGNDARSDAEGKRVESFEGVDVTREYAGIVDAFYCDLNIARQEGGGNLATLQELIDEGDGRLMGDIDRLGELSVMLRNGLVKVVRTAAREEVDAWNEAIKCLLE